MHVAAVARERASPGDGALTGIYAGIAAYYSAKVARFGATPSGVDWTCQATQEMRFVLVGGIVRSRTGHAGLVCHAVGKTFVVRPLDHVPILRHQAIDLCE